MMNKIKVWKKWVPLPAMAGEGEDTFILRFVAFTDVPSEKTKSRVWKGVNASGTI
jgi:hypothetical protein